MPNKITDAAHYEFLAKQKHQKTVLWLLAIFYPFWWILFKHLVPKAVDPIALRLGLMSMILFGLVKMHVSELNKKTDEYIIFLVLCLVTIHAFIYVYLNPSLVEARIQLDMTIYATALLLVSGWQVLIYMVLVVIINLLSFNNSPDSHAQIVVVFSQITFFSVLWFTRPIRIWSYRALQLHSKKIHEMYDQQNLMIKKLSHDLRTPLVPMVALLPKIEERTTDEKNRRMLAIVGQNIQYMKNLVEKAMDYSFITSGEAKLNFEIIDLHRLSSEVIASFESIQGHRLQFQKLVPPDTEVLADRNKVLEVLYNLLSNASRHTPDGGTISIEARPEPENNRVRISVTDTGEGMTGEQLGRAFELFYKADKARGDHSSVGLGLPICREIITKHNQSIWLESMGPGCGTTVLFNLSMAVHNKQENNQ